MKDHTSRPSRRSDYSSLAVFVLLFIFFLVINSHK